MEEKVDYSILQSNSLAFLLLHWNMLVIAPTQREKNNNTDGTKDITNFLNRISTADFMSPSAPGTLLPALFLTRTSHPVGFGFFLQHHGEYIFYFPSKQPEQLLEHIDSLHFTEPISFSLSTSMEKKPFLVLYVEKNKDKRKRLIPQLESFSSFQSAPLSINFFPDAFLFSFPHEKLSQLQSFFQSENVAIIKDEERYHAYALLHTIPLVSNLALHNRDMALEMHLDFFIANAKGCYPGQEVVERTKTYGQTKRALYTIEFPFFDILYNVEYPIILSGKSESTSSSHSEKTIGRLISFSCPHPYKKNYILGLCFLEKQYDEDTSLVLKDTMADTLYPIQRVASINEHGLV